jgi:hypothetical protein
MKADAIDVKYFLKILIKAKIMRTRKTGYWICLALAIAALVAALIMKGLADSQVRDYAKFVGYAAVALVLIGRLFFGGTAKPAPPMPRD